MYASVLPGAAPVLLGLRRCAAVICVAGAVLWCSPGGRMYAPVLPGAAPVLLGLRRCAAVICVAGAVF